MTGVSQSLSIDGVPSGRRLFVLFIDLRPCLSGGKKTACGGRGIGLKGITANLIE